MYIFSSGTCRVLTTINIGNDKFIPIHTTLHNFQQIKLQKDSINYISFIHNTKSHIEFINNILSENIDKLDLSNYPEQIHAIPASINLYQKLQNIKNNFHNCSVYIFEISSIKIAKYNDKLYVPENIPENNKYYIQSEKELCDDLLSIYNLIKKISNNKKIIFIPHIRPQIISNTFKKIANRELIYNTIYSFTNTHSDCYIFDIAEHLKNNPKLISCDFNHLTLSGHNEIQNKLFTFINNIFNDN